MDANVAVIGKISNLNEPQYRVDEVAVVVSSAGSTAGRESLQRLLGYCTSFGELVIWLPSENTVVLIEVKNTQVYIVFQESLSSLYPDPRQRPH